MTCLLRTLVVTLHAGGAKAHTLDVKMRYCERKSGHEKGQLVPLLCHVSYLTSKPAYILGLPLPSPLFHAVRYCTLLAPMRPPPKPPSAKDQFRIVAGILCCAGYAAFARQSQGLPFLVCT